MKRHRQRGFTLVEVLVALVIVAFGIGALLTTLTSAADNVAHLRDKSFAEWIALNRISELRLESSPPSVGKRDGELDFAGTRWRWRQEITDPGMAGMRRVEISVARADTDAAAADADEATALATAWGFFGQAVGPASGIDPDWSTESLAGVAGGNGAPEEKK